MTCAHRLDADDVCIDCGYDDGLRYMQPTQDVLRLADLPRPDGEKHDMEPPHDLCLGDDPCICIQLNACEQRVANKIAALRGEKMTHDPLCRNQNDPDPKCHACHLIDMARQDERERTLDAARKAVLAVEPFSMLPLLLKTQDALAAIDALREKA